MMRVSYIGELGWEIYSDAAYGRRSGTAVGGR
jgi:glycine cleavage system aminomethyltransferase T